MKKIMLLVVLFFAVSMQSYSTNVEVKFPDDLDTESERRSLEGKTLVFNQTLFVNSVYYWEKYGQVTLSSQRNHVPTEIHRPGSQAYRDEVARNEIDQIVLDDGTDETYPNPLPWADENGTIRAGYRVDGLVAKLVNTEYGWMLVPEQAPVFYGNERPEPLKPIAADKVRLCGFNLEHYIVSDFGSGFGPDNEEQSARQHAKISKALKAIDADVYALCEVQTGQAALKKLTDELNRNTDSKTYNYVDDGTHSYGSYSKVGFIYRSDKLEPIASIKSNDVYLKDRKKGQGFKLKENGGGFIVLLNHYKAKSGTASGSNADKGDGQGSYNAARVDEAESTVIFAKQCITHFKDNDVIIVGDLNSHSQEDPIRVLDAADYESMIYRFAEDDEEIYSYSYRGTIGLLDHAHANRSMASQVEDCFVYHINTDEPTRFGYSSYGYVDNMYRCSDHDPVIVEMKINATDTSLAPPVVSVLYSRVEKGRFTVINAKDHYLDIYNYAGIKLFSAVVDRDEVSYDAESLGLQHGVYILRLRETKFYDPETTTLKLIVSSK